MQSKRYFPVLAVLFLVVAANLTLSIAQAQGIDENFITVLPTLPTGATDDYFGPTVVDTDGDGFVEFYGTRPAPDCKLYGHDVLGNTLNNYPIDLLQRSGLSECFYGRTRPAVADLDNDGQKEIITQLPGGQRLFVLNQDGTPFGTCPLQGVPINYSFGSPGIVRIAGEKHIAIRHEIPMGGFAGHDRLLILDKNCTLFTEIDLIEGMSQADFASGDVNYDGYDEVALLTPGKINLWDLKTGQQVPGFPQPLNSGFSYSHAPTLADLDQDGHLDVIATERGDGTTSKVHALDRHGNALAGWPVTITHQPLQPLFGPPTVADIDGDYDLEVILTSSVFIYVLSHDGNNISPWFYYTDNLASIAQMTVSDFNADGNSDIAVLQTGDLKVLDSQAQVIFSLDLRPYFLSTAVVWTKTSMTFADGANDGDLDLYLAFSTEDFSNPQNNLSAILGLDFQVPFSPNSCDWLSYHRNPGHTRRIRCNPIMTPIPIKPLFKKP